MLERKKEGRAPVYQEGGSRIWGIIEQLALLVALRAEDAWGDELVSPAGQPMGVWMLHSWTLSSHMVSRFTQVA